MIIGKSTGIRMMIDTNFWPAAMADRVRQNPESLPYADIQYKNGVKIVWFEISICGESNLLQRIEKHMVSGYWPRIYNEGLFVNRTKCVRQSELGTQRIRIRIHMR